LSIVSGLFTHVHFENPLNSVTYCFIKIKI
jgi:hypothetical protein